jgi:hypothetical protein
MKSVLDSMIIKGRWKGAFIMIVLWSIAVTVTALFFGDRIDEAMILISMLSSSFLLGIGMVIYLGEYMVLAGVNTMSEKERSQYNMDEITSFMGIILAIESFVIFVALACVWDVMYFVIGILVFLAILVVAIVYVNISNRFKTDPQAKKLYFVQR